MTADNYVLVVDDEKDLRDVITVILGGAGIAVRTAEDGGQALQMLAASRPALVLLDLFLPVMNGWQVAERIKQDPLTASVPIVVMSAARDSRPPEGIDGYLRKPFELTELVALAQRFTQPQ